MPAVDTHRKTFLRTLRHSLASAACREGHTVVTQTARSLSLEALRLSCPRQSLPGSRIPEGLHCHQQSFSSMRSLRIAGRNALCSFSFVPFAYLYPKHAHKHFTHESNCKSCFVYLIHVTPILIMLPISNANRNLYKRANHPVMPLFKGGYYVHNTSPVFQFMLFNEIIMSRLVILNIKL